MGDRSMKDELIPTSMTLQMQLGIWRVIQSQSAISISWVSFQWNVGTESWRTRWRIETRDWRNDTPTSIGSATCGVCNVIQSQSPSSRSLCNVIQSQSPISIFSVSLQSHSITISNLHLLGLFSTERGQKKPRELHHRVRFEAEEIELQLS